MECGEEKKEKSLQAGTKNPTEASYRNLLDTFFHQFLQKVKVFVLVGHTQHPLYITQDAQRQGLLLIGQGPYFKSRK